MAKTFSTRLEMLFTSPDGRGVSQYDLPVLGVHRYRTALKVSGALEGNEPLSDALV